MRTSIRSEQSGAQIAVGQALLDKAMALNVDVSQAAEAGLKAALAVKRGELWLQENRAALESSNAFVATQGLPLARYQGF